MPRRPLAFVRTYDWLTPLVDELVGAEDSMMFPLVNYALEQVVGENRQETLFDERRLTRDASTAEFYESLFGAEDEDDALTKKFRGGSFLKQDRAGPDLTLWILFRFIQLTIRQGASRSRHCLPARANCATATLSCECGASLCAGARRRPTRS